MKAAIINASTNEVVNVIELDKNSNWEAPENHQVVFSENASIGTFHVQGEFLTLEEFQNL